MDITVLLTFAFIAGAIGQASEMQEDALIYKINRIPIEQAYLEQRFLIEMMCRARIRDTKCTQRHICLSNGQQFSSTCEYQSAMCQDTTIVQTKLIPCQTSQVKDCRMFINSSCKRMKLEPVCAYHSNKYYDNLCEACQSKNELIENGKFIELKSHRGCILSRTGDRRLLDWAKQAVALQT